MTTPTQLHQGRPGTVYLVGAGPGDPSLLTVRGLRLLRRADAVVYDRLVHPSLIDEVPRSAARIYVGKAPGAVGTTQDEINAILITQATRGRVVVRLKGGDPFVFGRGGEEALALAAAGVAFEVVPGVTSAISAPAYAGIPVTHRGVARAFTVVTGHTCTPGEEADWAALARAGTLVVLMGLRRLAHLAEQLIFHGLDATTPVAVVCSGSTAQQTVLVGTLATIGAQSAHLRPPATVVVGEVVRLQADLSWFAPAARPVADALFTHPSYAIPA